MYGKCSYVLVDHCHYGTGNKEFEIVVKNDQCSQNALYTSCLRTIFVNLTRTNTVVYLGSKKGPEGRRLPTASVNGQGIRHKSTTKYQIDTIGEEGVVFMMKEKELKIHWTGHNVYITVGTSFLNQTCGLCGTYNERTDDDFHTRSDTTETNVVTFTQDWIYKSDDYSEDQGECHKSWGDTSEKPCDIYSAKQQYAQDMCSVILKKDGPFARCHRIETPNKFYQTCRQDACKCEDCYCDVLSAYAKACMDKGVTLANWRDKTQHCSK